MIVAISASSLLVHEDIMKPFGDIQENVSYIMKISINNEKLKYLSTIQKVQKEVLLAINIELWSCSESRFA